MKILITGGAGFIGGNFCHYMVDKYPNYSNSSTRCFNLCR
jgi:dTDP-D-glucose 4,6-dehydratase